MTRLVASLSIALLVLVVPGLASAASVTRGGDGTLLYSAAAGEQNRLSIQVGYDESTIVFYEGGAAIDPNVPSGCTREAWTGADTVTCPNPPAVTVDLGDGNDSLTETLGLAVPVTARGGSGDDTLSGADGADRFDGGPGNDKLDGGGGDDTLLGGEGDDLLEGKAGRDHLEGGEGQDTLSPDGHEEASADYVDGGPGIDQIVEDYASRFVDFSEQPPVSITLGGGADDGRPGENDDIRGVEHLTLSTAGSVTGTDAPELIKFIQVGGSVTIDAAGGDDTIVAGDGNDTVYGGAGNDDIDAGFGNDTIVPGPGQDVVSADNRGGDCGPLWCKYPYGDDTIDARDGEVDHIECGGGIDTVKADPQDIVADDCEHVIRDAATGSSGRAGQGTNAPKLTVGATSISLALAHGLRVRVNGATPGALLSLGARRSGKLVASGRARADRSGAATVTLRFSSAGKRLLRKARSARLVIAGSGVRGLVVLRRAGPRPARASAVGSPRLPGAIEQRAFKVDVKGFQATTWTLNDPSTGECDPAVSGSGSERIVFRSEKPVKVMLKRYGTSYVILGDPYRLAENDIATRASVTRHGHVQSTPVSPACGENGGMGAQPAADCGTKQVSYDVQIGFLNDPRHGFTLGKGDLAPLGDPFQNCPATGGVLTFPDLLEEQHSRPIVAAIPVADVFDPSYGQQIVIGRGAQRTSVAGLQATTRIRWDIRLTRIRR